MSPDLRALSLSKGPWQTAPYLTFTVGVLGLTAAAFLVPLGRDATPFVLVCIPAVMAVVVALARGGRPELRTILERMARWRVAPGWYAVALGIPLLQKLVVAAVGLAVGITTVSRLVPSVTLTAAVVPFVVLLPALVEEVGWRGFAVPTAIDQGRTTRWAVIVTSLVMLAVHLPLHLPGQLYAGLPLWAVVPLVLTQSLLCSWLYLGTGSALMTGLMHAAFNATVPLTWGLDAVWVWQVRPCVLTAVCLVLFATSRSFRRVLAA